MKPNKYYQTKNSPLEGWTAKQDGVFTNIKLNILL
jgi:hypothetical protein